MTDRELAGYLHQRLKKLEYLYSMADNVDEAEYYANLYEECEEELSDVRDRLRDE